MGEMMYDVLEKVELEDGTLVEVLQFSELNGSADVSVANTLYFASNSGMRLKMIRITSYNSFARIEPGSLYFMKGNLENKTSTGGGILKGLGRKVLSGESLFVNEIHGTGQIYLEPSFGHFFIRELGLGDQALIMDQGMFYAGTRGLDISSTLQKNISAGVFGGEGLFQTQVKGSGVVVLYSPVPANEVQKIELDNEKLSVDGNFALLRTEEIEFKAEKSSKTWIGTAVSGEGLLQTFSGTGTVRLAPTQGIYQLLSAPRGLHKLSLPPGSVGLGEDT